MPFGIGPGELILILVVALVVFGPRRLPELGSAVGKAIREFRQASSELTREFSAEARESHAGGHSAPPAPAAPAIAEAPARVEENCPSCGAANSKGNKFCGSCGQGIAVPKDDEEACPDCGTANPKTNKFCGRCGRLLIV